MNTHDRSMWDTMHTMSDAQAEANAMYDPDSQPTDAMFWANVGMQEPDSRKEPIHSA